MLGEIASNFLKKRTGWNVVQRHATTLVQELTFFHQLLENSRYHFNACNTLISWKKTRLLNGKEIDDSTENLSGITNDHQNYEEWEREVEIVIGASKRKVNARAEDCKNPNLQYK